LKILKFSINALLI